MWNERINKKQSLKLISESKLVKIHKYRGMTMVVDTLDCDGEKHKLSQSTCQSLMYKSGLEWKKVNQDVSGVEWELQK